MDAVGDEAEIGVHVFNRDDHDDNLDFDLFQEKVTGGAISRKLGKRQDMKLVGYGLNVYLKIYQVQYFSPKEAKRSFRRIVGRKVEKTDVYGELMAKTGVIVDT
jgi:hypothetical protein